MQKIKQNSKITRVWLGILVEYVEYDEYDEYDVVLKH